MKAKTIQFTAKLGHMLGISLLVFLTTSTFTQAQGYYYGAGTAYQPTWAEQSTYTPSLCTQNSYLDYDSYPSYQPYAYSNSYYSALSSSQNCGGYADTWSYPNSYQTNYSRYYSQYYSPYYSTYSYSDGTSGTNEPQVTTSSVTDIADTQAELRGSVDMNSYRNGVVFFVYGQDEDAIADVADDYDTYDDVDDDTTNDEFMVVRVDNDLDDEDSYVEEVDDLEVNEDYYVTLCVEYDDGDELLECGNVREFTTDDDGSNGDEPDASTSTANEISDDSANLRGNIDMNDFENGTVFFVYGEDEDLIDAIEDESTYDDIDEDGDDLQKVLVDSDLDGEESYEKEIFNLDSDTTIYFRICVAYEDDGDATLACGTVRDFDTDN